MKYYLTQHDLRERPNWRAMMKTDARIVEGIQPTTRDKITAINQGEYIAVYEYTMYDPIKVLQFTNAITYYYEDGILKSKMDPFVQKVITETGNDNFIMISRNQCNVLIVGTLDMNSYEDSIIQSPYLIREGYLCITPYKINENLSFTPLNKTIKKIKQLQRNDIKPLDLDNPEDLRIAEEIYLRARDRVYQNHLAI